MFIYLFEYPKTSDRSSIFNCNEYRPVSRLSYKFRPA